MKNLKYILLLPLTVLFCLVMNKTQGQIDQRVCTEPITPRTICIEGSDSTGNRVGITDSNSSFNCGIELFNDTCFTYTPIPGINFTDTVVVKACNTYEPTMCNELTVLVDIKEVCDDSYNTNDDFYNVMLANEFSFNVLLNDELDESETYEISLIVEEENPYISIEANSPNINVKIDKAALENEFRLGNLNEDLLVWYPDENSSNGGTNNYNYAFKYALCNSNLNCDTSTVTLSLVLAILLSNEDQFESYQFKIYPNPVADVLFLSSDKLIEGLQIYDAASKMLFDKTLNQRAHLLNEDISFLQNGLYFISLQLENDRQIIEKMYKQ